MVYNCFVQGSRHGIALLAGLLFSFASMAQKKLLQQKDYEGWIRDPLYGARISDDGQHVIYNDANNTCVIRSLQTNRQKKYSGVNATDLRFEGTVVIGKKGDSLLISKLSDGSDRYIPRVTDYKIKDHLLAVRLSNSTLIIYNVQNNKELYRYNDVDQFALDRHRLAFSSKTGLMQVDIATGKSELVWAGKKCSQLTLGNNRDIAFVGDSSIWYYKTGRAIELVHEVTGMTIADQPLHFTTDNKQVLFVLQKPFKRRPQGRTELVAVDVWTYHDAYPLSDDMPNDGGHTVHAAVNTTDKKLVLLDAGKSETLAYNGHVLNSAYMLINVMPAEEHERYWNDSAQQCCRLIETATGKQIAAFPAHGFFLHPMELSPYGKYVVYYNYDKNAWHTYNIATGITRNISQTIPVPMYDEESDMTAQPAFAHGMAGWTAGDRTLWVYDRYDIWELDPEGLRPPVNLTKGYGRAHRIRFRRVRSEVPIDEKATQLLAASNHGKDNGFYKLNITNGKGPQEFVPLQPCLFYFPGSFVGDPPPPVKAKNADVYLVSKQSAADAINLYLITEKGKLAPLTNHQPQKEYNWMTSELIEWTTYDGKPSQGILYKPENFDPNKKYPVIFYYYMNGLSGGLHQFLKPECSVLINTPYYTSNGYLVCVTDIQFTKGKPSASAYNSVVSAARKIAALPYVDSTRMGIAGHSFGSYETNCLVASTNLFAAAYSGCGYSNVVSLYGEGPMQLMWCERGQTSIGASLSERPDLYIENSPVFNSNRVTTPLLMLNNKQDKTNFMQGVQFYSALRRQGKKVWLLQYDNGGHTMSGAEAQDFSIRQAQFFDHFLKQKPAPVWMTKGIHPTQKGIIDGLELDVQSLSNNHNN
jgi:hypothetical protein